MAESTLSLAISDMRLAVAKGLSYGVDYDGLTTAKKAHVNRIIDAGVRSFLFPPPIREGKQGHEWSFLKPAMTVVAWPETTGTVSAIAAYDSENDQTEITVSVAAFYSEMVGASFKFDTTETEYVIKSYSGTTKIFVTGNAKTPESATDTFTIEATGNSRLPDYFGGLEGVLTFEPQITNVFVRQRGSSEIRIFRQQSSITGRPQYVGVRVLQHAVTIVGQRYEMCFYPTPSELYTLTYKMLILPDKYSATILYMVGGMPHVETIKEFCLAEVEAEDDDKGIHTERKMVRLTASIDYDNRMGGQQFFGYNRDASGGRGYEDGKITYVTYNDVLYDNG